MNLITKNADFPEMLNHNHSHSQVVNRIPKYAQVLELGCANGEMSRLINKVCEARVFGVEKDPQLAWQAQRYCDYVLTEDLDEAGSLDALEFEKFDVITLVDVLEHLRYPESLLTRLKALMMDESTIILSVPNVAHASVRLELLTGDFRYEDSGILDDTHLRFYTLSSLTGMLERCGFVVNDIDYTWHDIPDSVTARYLRQVGIETTPKILDYFHQPDAVAYQFILSVSLPKQPARLQASNHRDGDVLTPEVTPPTEHKLKPMAASWQTWGHVFKNLQEKEQVILGMDLQIQSFQQEIAELKLNMAEQSEELKRVYATRSWRILRKLAMFWRGTFKVQGGLTHS